MEGELEPHVYNFELSISNRRQTFQIVLELVNRLSKIQPSKMDRDRSEMRRQPRKRLRSDSSIEIECNRNNGNETKRFLSRGQTKLGHVATEYCLTQNGVHSLVTGAALSTKENGTLANSLVLKLRVDVEPVKTSHRSDDEALAAMVSDGTSYVKVLLSKAPTNSNFEYRSRDLIVSVDGYVTADFHPQLKFHKHPFICLTSLSILAATPATSLGDPYQTPVSDKKQTIRLHGGTSGTFLAQRTPFLTNEELAGSGESKILIEESVDKKSFEDHVVQVSAFLARHSAMMTLQSSPGGSASEQMSVLSCARHTDLAVQNYTSALKEFLNSQLDRQKASLATNAGREAASRASLIMERYIDTLDHALSTNEHLSQSLLCEWHSRLLKDLNPEAGQIRNRTVKAGHTVFAPPEKIHYELSNFCKCLQSLQSRLSFANAIHAILFASVAMFGVVDIHPFSDGNGRLCRVVANWALRRAGLPFPINLFATPAQRAEYICAIQQTRQNLSVLSRGNVSHDETLQAIKWTGVFSPLIRLFMNRVAHAASELTRVWDEKSGLAAEAAEAQAARRARERASQGTCIICLDEKPNIATLCCGKAVHLNCIAEWLSGRNSCPVCRSELPSISDRVGNRTSATNVEREEERRLRAAEDVIVSLLSVDDEDTSFETSETTDDDSATSTDHASTTEDAHALNTAPTSRNANVTQEANDDTTEDTTDDTTSSNAGADLQSTSSTTAALSQLATTPRYCNALYCRNRPAVDCTNSLCGRCCVLGGEFQCPRHNS